MPKLLKELARLYCGTTERVAKLAPVAGLNPSSAPVYLSDVYPGYFALLASTSDQERFGIIEVDLTVLDPANLLPSESYLDQISRHKARNSREHHKKLEMYRKNLEKYKSKWRDSLQRMGICVYDGFIPRKALRKITIYDPVSNPTITGAIVEAHVGLSDYKRNFHRNKALTRWLVGESVQVEDWLGEDLLTTPKDEKEQLAERLQNKLGLDIFYYEPPPKGL
jgi:hypothetical protein